MGTQTILILLLIGLLAGILGGMVGVGGGIIVVPALVLVLGYTQQQAQGASLVLLLLPVGVLAVINYYKQGYVDFKVVFIMAAAFILGGWIGSKLALSLPADTVKRIFGLFIIGVGIKMVFFGK